MSGAASFDGDENNIAAVFKMFARGALASPINTISVSDLSDDLKRLDAGDVQGRLPMVNARNDLQLRGRVR